MAMSREDQKAASDRIMAKNPLTEDEMRLLKMRTRLPGEYEPPKGVRVCATCGAEFQDEVDGKGIVLKPALAQFSDHLASHNPSPAQWAEAHSRIEAGKESSKRQDKAS